MDDRLFTVPMWLIEECQTNDPFKIVQRLSKYCGKEIRIKIKYFTANRQKGFCTNILNNYYICINDSLSYPMMRMVCGHELGHILLHPDRLGRDKNGKFKRLVEWELFDIKDNTEYEANMFLANLIIDTDRLKDLIYEGNDIVRIAALMDVNVNLVALKVAQMKFDGVKVPFIPNKNFLGKIVDDTQNLF